MAEPKPAAPPKPRGLVNLRVSDADRALIDRAARAQGTNRSEFMLAAARRAAEDALLDRTFLQAEPEVFARFVALLDGPARGNERLERLRDAPSPWE